MAVTELVPFATNRAAHQDRTGEPTPHFPDLLTAQEARLIGRYCSYELFFSSHGDDIFSYRAAEPVQRRIMAADPGATCVLAEGGFVMPHVEEALNKEFRDRMSARRRALERATITRAVLGALGVADLDVFSFMRLLAAGRGIDAYTVNLDAYTAGALSQYRHLALEARRAEKSRQLVDLFETDALGLSMVELAQRYDTLVESTNDFEPKRGSLAGRLVDDQRDRASVIHALDLGLRHAREQEYRASRGRPTRKKDFIFLMGGAHQQGICQRFDDHGVAYTADNLYPWDDSVSDFSKRASASLFLRYHMSPRDMQASHVIDQFAPVALALQGLDRGQLEALYDECRHTIGYYRERAAGIQNRPLHALAQACLPVLIRLRCRRNTSRHLQTAGKQGLSGWFHNY